MSAQIFIYLPIMQYNFYFAATELASAIAAIAQENVATPALIAGAGNGYTGFYMAFWQNSC